MEKAREIIREHDGYYSRLFPTGTPQVEKKLCSLLRKRTDRKIIAFMTNNSRLTNKQLVALTGLAKSTISHHLTQLLKLGVIKIDNPADDDGPSYWLESAERVWRLIEKQDNTFLRRVTDRFIDLWDLEGEDD